MGRNGLRQDPNYKPKGEYTCEIIKELVNQGIKVNITAILSKNQIDKAISVLDPNVDSIISIFAGRIADTGLNPTEYIKYSLLKTSKIKKCEVLWASTREIFNLYEASRINCDIITIPSNLLNKLDLKDKDLEELSLETIKMFYEDALSTGYKI